MTTFGSVLRDIMAEQGLRQAHVADASDLDHAHLSRMLAGQRTATRETVVRIVNGCALDAQDSLRLFVAAGFVPDGSDALLLDPQLQLAAEVLNDESIPLPYRASLRQQISALVGITRQMAA